MKGLEEIREWLNECLLGVMNDKLIMTMREDPISESFIVERVGEIVNGVVNERMELYMD